MTQGSAQFEYVDGQLRPAHGALLERFARDSADAMRTLAPLRDRRYGEHPRQTFDLFRAAGRPRALLAYFHGGYWQSRDKSDFAFIAPALVAARFDVALVNYPLCPDVSLAGLTESVREAMPFLKDAAGETSLILIGHSAGGAIVTDLAAGADAIVAISGVFDVRPLVATTLNQRLQLDAAGAEAASALLRVGAGSPALFAVGGDETAAFREQNSAMHAAWSGAGNRSQALEIPGADHFSILTELADANSALRLGIEALL